MTAVIQSSCFRVDRHVQLSAKIQCPAGSVSASSSSSLRMVLALNPGHTENSSSAVLELPLGAVHQLVSPKDPLTCFRALFYCFHLCVCPGVVWSLGPVLWWWKDGVGVLEGSHAHPCTTNTWRGNCDVLPWAQLTLTL